jgi:hypothetical protein
VEERKEGRMKGKKKGRMKGRKYGSHCVDVSKMMNSVKRCKYG